MQIGMNQFLYFIAYRARAASVLFRPVGTMEILRQRQRQRQCAAPFVTPKELRMRRTVFPYGLRQLMF
jgi:hypothetical protein